VDAQETMNTDRAIPTRTVALETLLEGLEEDHLEMMIVMALEDKVVGILMVVAVAAEEMIRMDRLEMTRTITTIKLATVSL